MVLDQGAATSGSSKVIYISLAYGFSLLVTVWAFYRISGGLFNPAVRVELEDKNLPSSCLGAL